MGKYHVKIAVLTHESNILRYQFSFLKGFILNTLPV